jgi:hypothetical protein
MTMTLYLNHSFLIKHKGERIFILVNNSLFFSPTTSSLILENNANINSAHLAFENVIQLKRCIDRLPLDITFVNISMDENHVLWLTRCHALYEPIVIKLFQIDKVSETILKLICLYFEE